MKVFLSVPMRFKSDEQIKSELEMLKHYFLATSWPGKTEAEFVHNFVPGEEPTYSLPDREERKVRLERLSKAIAKMADCSLVLFYPGWEGHNGCCIEHDICRAYDIRYIEV